MKESLLLARADFMNVVFLLGLILVISRGLNFVWMLPEPESWATLVGAWRTCLRQHRAHSRRSSSSTRSACGIWKR